MTDKLGKIKRTYQIPFVGDESCETLGDAFIWEWENGKYGYSINTETCEIEYETEELAVEFMSRKARREVSLKMTNLENELRQMKDVVVSLSGEKGRFNGSYGDDEYRTTPKTTEEGGRG